MTKKKETGSKKLKLKKETLKDLDSRKGVKGGAMVAMTATCAGCRQDGTHDGTTTQPVYPVLLSAGCGIKGRG